MLKILNKRYILTSLMAMSLLFFPILAEAGGGCGCKSSYDYYSYYPGTGRTQSAFYPSYSYYPSTYSSFLPSYSSYPLSYSYGSPFSYGGSGLNYGYPWGGGVVTSKDYTVEQSRTVYVPGGEITNSISESTEVSFPQFGYSLNPYNSFGLYNSFGGWGSPYTGFGWY